MIFNFEHMFMDIEKGKKCFYHREWKLPELKDILGRWMTYMADHNGWDSLYLGKFTLFQPKPSHTPSKSSIAQSHMLTCPSSKENHDQPRILGRWANATSLRAESAKMLAIFHATGRGTLFLYQGQEIGMANSTWTVDELRDVEEINFYHEEKARRPVGADMSDVLDRVGLMGRDNARTLMQWDGSANAGFSTSGKPWIKVNPDYEEWNMEKQLGDGESVLEFWRGLLRVRKENKGLVYGRLGMVDRDNEDVYAYTRTDEKIEYLVVCSFRDRAVEWNCPVERGEVLVGSYPSASEAGKTLHLRPYEGLVFRRSL